ncbi:DUF6300 family protein [Streptomyces sp. NPDC048462]|uniref:DUF6300 family protein n=1 Tax=Streptomyces sp. NPDC048462 TaxID=3365555 RepID=UPI00371DE53C
MTGLEEIDVQVDGLPACGVCGQPPMLRVSFPSSWNNARGQEVSGRREALLCPRCERGAPSAENLLAFFAVDGQLDMANAEVFSELLGVWVEDVRKRRVDTAELAAQEEQFRRGEL